MDLPTFCFCVIALFWLGYLFLEGFDFGVGLPLDAHGNRVGGPLTILTLPTIIGALAVWGFSFLHGAMFLALKTEGDVRERARLFALRFGGPLLLPVIALVLIAQLAEGST